MRNLNENYYNSAFTHIYVEEAIWEHPRTKMILQKFPKAQYISIHHYKDVFCRKKQNHILQGTHPMLILAEKPGRLIYEGAPVCQNFGNENFYYTSCVMNCVYDCEYCYLKGMYPSGNLVIFVNLEDIFTQLLQLLESHRVYLCVSYDTDLMALENITGYVKEWTEFAAKHENLCIEIRTKCGRKDLWEKLTPGKQVIFAFTLSPENIQQRCEHKTATLSERIACARQALEYGFSVRLCFDPMIYCPNWKEQYDGMLEQILKKISPSDIQDVSVGSFRISQEYLKKLRKNQKNSAAVQFPFENIGGVYQYPDRIQKEMEEYMMTRLRQYIPEQRIFRWNR